MKEDFDRRWQQLSDEVMNGMKEWRLKHPRAKLSEIEDALDERLGKMRALMLQDVAQVSVAAALNDEAGQHLKCPQCGRELGARGERERRLQTYQHQQLEFKRGYGECPQCGAGFFLLDEELELLSEKLTPRLAKSVVRLGTWMPFGRAAQELEHLLGVQVSEVSVRRLSERAGASYVTVQEAEVERLERELPAAPPALSCNC